MRPCLRPSRWLISAGLLTWSAIAAAQGVPAAAPAPVASPGADTAEVASAPGDPSAEVQAEYRDVVARAVTEFDAGRWAEARALFVRAHELSQRCHPCVEARKLARALPGPWLVRLATAPSPTEAWPLECRARTTHGYA